jgi:hypothetical protein
MMKGVTKQRTWYSSYLEWVCCCGQEDQEAKSPETKGQMHRGSAPDPERSRRKLPRQGRGGALARSTWNRPSAHAKKEPSPPPPREDSEMQEKRTGPRTPRAGHPEARVD